MTLRETAERNSLRDAADRVLDGRRYGVLAINYWDGLRDAIEAALLAERTRCAEIAETKAVEYERESKKAELIDNSAPNFWAIRARAARCIAAAIADDSAES